jgi:hypothetical protein
MVAEARSFVGRHVKWQHVFKCQIFCVILRVPALKADAPLSAEGIPWFDFWPKRHDMIKMNTTQNQPKANSTAAPLGAPQAGIN